VVVTPIDKAALCPPPPVIVNAQLPAATGVTDCASLAPVAVKAGLLGESATAPDVGEGAAAGT